ncbi:MAG: hypothetical protein AMJ58_10910 [Gammaproteobacteria bacterium SG8_30]|jgi:Na+-transporting methylmalonyl-CoA/oxaloacetate decarboxylase gamma subunit|nr:MAG: hypothetical protein AMJ58_10910 [Gammaproteobacteria bacterium SG8_30]
MRRLNTILIILAFATAGVGCASNVDRHWGESVRANTEAQVANPVAALRNADKDVAALDGQSADNADQVLRKHESRKGGESRLPDIIQIGGGR